MAEASEDDRPTQHALQRFHEALPDMVASAGTGLIDLAVTGLPSAGALAPVLGLGVRLSVDARARRRDRGGRALEAAAKRIGGLDRLESLAAADDARMELTARTLEAAMRTTHEAKIRALGAVLAAGLDGHATVDLAQILLGALEVIEAPHVQLLAVLRDNADHNAPLVSSANHAELLTMARAQLLERLPGHSSALGAVLQVLEGQHLIEPVGLGLTYESWGGPGRWAITDLGRVCLGRLEEAAE